MFEELLDAPSRVLTNLKDTLTARELRNGHQRFPMTTSVIFGPTNHSPQEIAEGGRAVAALIERFPVQLEVDWPNYSEDSFTELFAVVTGDKPSFETITWGDVAVLQERARNVVFSPLMQRMLARIIVELRRDNVVISPRTAIMAMQLVKAAAAINGRDKATAQDIAAIAFLPGAHSLKSRISELITECINSMIGEEELDRLEEVFKKACDSTAATESDLEGLVQILDEIRDKVTNLKLETSQSGRRQDLLRRIKPVRAETQESLGDFLRERNRQEHEKTLKELGQMISTFGENYRYGSDNQRADAQQGLRRTKSHLNGMKVHPELEAQRQELLMKIQLTGAC